MVAYLKAAEMGMEVGQSNAAWMLTRGYGAQGPAASALAQKLHQRAAGQVPPLPTFSPTFASADNVCMTVSLAALKKHKIH